MRRYRKTFICVLVFLAMQIAGGLLALFMRNFLRTDGATAVSFAYLFSYIVTMFMLEPLGIIRMHTFKVTHVKWSVIPLAFIAAFLGIFAMDLLLEQIRMPNLMRGSLRVLSNNPLGVLSIGVVAPIAEELIFREGIISTLLRNNFHRWQAILISAAIFGIVHVNPIQIPFAFVIGIILGIIFVKTGTIVIVSIIHILNNMIGIMEMRIRHDASASITQLIGGPIVAWICIIVSAVLCVICLRLFWKHHHRRHNNDHYNHR